MTVIRLWGGAYEIDCAGCGTEILTEGHAVAIDDCGQPSQRETGASREACKAFHDVHYGYAGTMLDAPDGCPWGKP